MDSMIVIGAVWLGVLGVLVGSFLNVVIVRMRTGRGLHGRSQCMTCQQTLAWYHLIPLISRVVLRGRCGMCKARIGYHYSSVELITGVLFAGAWLYVHALGYGGTSDVSWVLVLMIYLAMVCLLIVASVYDMRHKILPDSVVYPFIYSALALLFISPNEAGGIAFIMPTLDAFAGLVVPAVFLLVWLVSKGRAMGFGDITLMIGMALLLGLWPTVDAVVFAIWTGAIVGLVIVGIGRYKGHHRRAIMKQQIPFGPFLVAGILAVMTGFAVFGPLVVGL